MSGPTKQEKKDFQIDDSDAGQSHGPTESTVLSVRLRPETAVALSQAAQRAGVSLSGYAREILNEAATVSWMLHGVSVKVFGDESFVSPMISTGSTGPSQTERFLPAGAARSLS